MVNEEMTRWAQRPPEVREVRIDRKDIQRFAIATRASDPIHHDPEYARSLGYRDVVAPLMFFVSLRTGAYNQVPQTELHPEGTPLADIPPIEFTNAMAGETDADIHRPFVAGDDVRCSRRVVGLETKEGRRGTMTLARFEYLYSDDAGDPFVVERFTRLFL
ncbi:FAS1-like dehydratase domain-containing protein [Mycolicibacterium sp.]|uniref:FAS1-like dehydratase domain-containing protein n=2 Tax=Mycolicibacterium sp. TaxID=2320850 RepID=UPI003D0E215E